MLDLIHVGFFVNRRVRGDLITEGLAHLDCGNALAEHAFALDYEVVRALQAVQVHAPV